MENNETNVEQQPVETSTTTQVVQQPVQTVPQISTAAPVTITVPPVEQLAIDTEETVTPEVPPIVKGVTGMLFAIGCIAIIGFGISIIVKQTDLFKKAENQDTTEPTTITTTVRTRPTPTYTSTTTARTTTTISPEIDDEETTTKRVTKLVEIKLKNMTIDFFTPNSLYELEHNSNFIKLDEKLNFNNETAIKYSLKDGILKAYEYTSLYIHDGKNILNEYKLLDNVKESYWTYQGCGDTMFTISLTNDGYVYLDDAKLNNTKVDKIYYDFLPSTCDGLYVFYGRTYDDKIINLETGKERKDGVYRLIGDDSSYISTLGDIYINYKKQDAKAIGIIYGIDEVVTIDENYYCYLGDKKQPSPIKKLLYDKEEYTYIIEFENGEKYEVEEDIS